MDTKPRTERMQEQVGTETEVRSEWLTYRESEVYAGLSRTTLWRLVKSGRIRVARIGKAVRIQRSSLEEFLRRSADES